MAPAASGYAYGSRRRSAAEAEAEQEEERRSWADEARRLFHKHEGRHALVDGRHVVRCAVAQCRPPFSGAPGRILTESLCELARASHLLSRVQAPLANPHM